LLFAGGAVILRVMKTAIAICISGCIIIR